MPSGWSFWHQSSRQQSWLLAPALWGKGLSHARRSLRIPSSVNSSLSDCSLDVSRLSHNRLHGLRISSRNHPHQVQTFSLALQETPQNCLKSMSEWPAKVGLMCLWKNVNQWLARGSTSTAFGRYLTGKISVLIDYYYWKVSTSWLQTLECKRTVDALLQISISLPHLQSSCRSMWMNWGHCSMREVFVQGDCAIHLRWRHI